MPDNPRHPERAENPRHPELVEGRARRRAEPVEAQDGLAQDRPSIVTHTRVRFAETDAAGIVYYPSFYTWFAMGTDALLRTAGALRDGDGRPAWPLPTVESGATFISPLFYDDEIAIHTTVASVSRRSFRMEHEIRRNGEVMARGYEVRVLVRHENGRLTSQPLPRDLLAVLTGRA